MLDRDQMQDVLGCEAYGSDGEKIGKVGQIYLDDESGRPEWATINTGLFGTSESFVPLSDASYSGGRLEVRFDKDRVKNAPNVSTDEGHLSPDQERQLYDYYGVSYTGTDSVDTTREGYDTSGRTTDDAMTRSEEQLNIGTERREAGRARLRKYVVTEQQTVNVPVSREEVRLEREPITDANIDRATSGPDISEEEHEVVLTEEVPVVTKETRPVERVAMTKDTVTENESVSEEVRKERIEVEGDAITSDRSDDDSIR